MRLIKGLWALVIFAYVPCTMAVLILAGMSNSPSAAVVALALAAPGILYIAYKLGGFDE